METVVSLPTPFYSRDGIVIYCGDAREVVPQLPPASVDFIFTDPPYGHNNNNNDLTHRREAALGVPHSVHQDRSARPIANDGPEADVLVRWFICEADRLLVNGGCCCCCCCGGGPDPTFARWSLWLDAALGFKQMIVWDKGGLGMGWHYRRNYETVLVGQKRGGPCRWYGGHDVPNIVRIAGIRPSRDDHPTPKPVALSAWFLRLHAAPGHLVLDPFAGGGSTLIAARAHGCRAVGVEIEENYCRVAVERLRQQVFSLPPPPVPPRQLDLP